MVSPVADAALRPRAITDRVRAALGDTPVVAIVGARQVGTSTLMRLVVETSPAAWTSLTLDDLDVLDRALSDPAGLLASVPGPLALDEVQRAPEMLLAIKAAVDRDRRPGRFLLTGSADVFALPRYGDALTGRVESVTLRPFSQGELVGRRDAVNHLVRLRDALGDRFVRGVILHTGSSTAALAERIWALPIHALWEAGDAAMRRTGQLVQGGVRGTHRPWLRPRRAC